MLPHGSTSPDPPSSPPSTVPPPPLATGRTQSFGRHPIDEGFLGNFLAFLQTRAGGSKSPIVANQIVTDVAKFLFHTDEDKPDPHLLVSRKAIVSYHTKLEEAGIKASGQQLKLARLLTAADFLLVEEDGADDEAELFRRNELAGKLISTLTSSLSTERSQQQARKLSSFKPPSLDSLSGFIRSGKLTATTVLLQQAVKAGKGATKEERDRAMLILMGRIAYRYQSTLN